MYYLEKQMIYSVSHSIAATHRRQLSSFYSLIVQCFVWHIFYKLNKMVHLTLSPPIPLTLYHTGLTHLFNFWHWGTPALSPERRSAPVSKIKDGGLDQNGDEPFEQQQFETAGVEGVNKKV